jgi:hypothetical protein
MRPIIDAVNRILGTYETQERMYHNAVDAEQSARLNAFGELLAKHGLTYLPEVVESVQDVQLTVVRDADHMRELLEARTAPEWLPCVNPVCGMYGVHHFHPNGSQSTLE